MLVVEPPPSIPGLDAIGPALTLKLERELADD